MDEILVNVTGKLSVVDWRRMGELYGKNRAEELRKAIKALIKIAEGMKNG